MRDDFQSQVQKWVVECFGEEIAADPQERNRRFLEEALELVQALGHDREAVHQMVDYVYSRPAGDPPQELGGVMVTLASLCAVSGLDMTGAAETELARVSGPEVTAKIKAKNAEKPVF